MLMSLYVNIIDVSLRERKSFNINKVEAFNSLSVTMIILSHGGQLWGGNIPASCSPQHLTRLVITSGMRREKMSLRTSFFTVEITLVREVPTDWWSKSRDGAPSQGAALSVSPSDRTALFSLNEHWLEILGNTINSFLFCQIHYYEFSCFWLFHFDFAF